MKQITNSAYSAKRMVRVKCDVREGEMRGIVQGFCVRNGWTRWLRRENMKWLQSRSVQIVVHAW